MRKYQSAGTSGSWRQGDTQTLVCIHGEIGDSKTREGWNHTGRNLHLSPPHLLPSVSLGPSHLTTVSLGFVTCAMGVAVINNTSFAG